MEPIYGKNNKRSCLSNTTSSATRREIPPRWLPGAPCPGTRLPTPSTIEFLGGTYTVSHPDFTITGPTPLTNPERILFLRYLLDGAYALPGGEYLTYREFPLGGSLPPAVYRAVHQALCLFLRLQAGAAAAGHGAHGRPSPSPRATWLRADPDAGPHHALSAVGGG